MNDIILSSRSDGEGVIDQLAEIISQYEVVSISDLYAILGDEEHRPYTDSQWGWDSPRGMDVQQVREGWLLRLPPPVSIS